MIGRCFTPPCSRAPSTSDAERLLQTRRGAQLRRAAFSRGLESSQTGFGKACKVLVKGKCFVLSIFAILSVARSAELTRRNRAREMQRLVEARLGAERGATARQLAGWLEVEYVDVLNALRALIDRKAVTCELRMSERDEAPALVWRVWKRRTTGTL
jgi:hypothetical protein